MIAGTLNGAEGELRQGYFLAAALGPFTLSADATGVHLTATVRSHDEFRTAQPALTFCVRRQPTDWIWSVVSLHIADGRLTAELRTQGESNASLCGTGSRTPGAVGRSMD